MFVFSDYYNQTVSSLTSPSNLELKSDDITNRQVKFFSGDNSLTIYDSGDLGLVNGDRLSFTGISENNDKTYTVVSSIYFDGANRNYTEVIIQEPVISEPSIQFTDNTIKNGKYYYV